MIQNIALKNVWHRLNGALVVGGVIVTYFKSSENYDHEWRFRNCAYPNKQLRSRVKLCGLLQQGARTPRNGPVQ